MGKNKKKGPRTGRYPRGHRLLPQTRGLCRRPARARTLRDAGKREEAWDASETLLDPPTLHQPRASFSPQPMTLVAAFHVFKCQTRPFVSSRTWKANPTHTRHPLTLPQPPLVQPRPQAARQRGAPLRPSAAGAAEAAAFTQCWKAGGDGAPQGKGLRLPHCGGCSAAAWGSSPCSRWGSVCTALVNSDGASDWNCSVGQQYAQ